MRILRKNEIKDKVGLSSVTLWRLERAGKFPSRVQLGPRCVGWLENDVDEWLKSRPKVYTENTEGKQPYNGSQ